MDFANDVLMLSDKDTSEEELEQLVFGSRDAFREKLRTAGKATTSRELVRVGTEEDQAEEDDEFRGLHDDAVYMLSHVYGTETG